MALITLAPPFLTYRGRDSKVGGQVVYPVKSRSFARSFVVPFNPQTSLQTDIRTLFTTLTRNYSNVSDADYSGWKVLADAINRSDRNSQRYSLSPKAAYILINFWTFITGNAIDPVAPDPTTDAGILTISNLKRTALDTGWQFTYAWTGPNADLAIFNSPSLPGLRRQPRSSDYRFSTLDPLDAIYAITSAGGTITVPDTDSRFPLTTADRVGLRLVVLSDTHQPYSTVFYTSPVAAP